MPDALALDTAGNQFPLNLPYLIKIGLRQQTGKGRDAARSANSRIASIREAMRYKMTVHGKSGAGGLNGEPGDPTGPQ